MKQELFDIAHGERPAGPFCEKTGIASVRNLELYLLKMGLCDGREWSYGELANRYDVSRPRCVQICQTTEKRLKRYFGV